VTMGDAVGGDDAPLMRMFAGGDGDAIMTTSSGVAGAPPPPLTELPNTMRVSEVVTLPSGQTTEQLQPGTRINSAPVGAQNDAGAGAVVNLVEAAADQPASMPASQLAFIASRLPQIPPNLLRDVSFDQLPPAGTHQRQQVEAAIDWYFQQMTLATSSALNSMPSDKAVPPLVPVPPPLVAQVSEMSDASSLDSSASVVELATSLGVAPRGP